MKFLVIVSIVLLVGCVNTGAKDIKFLNAMADAGCVLKEGFIDREGDRIKVICQETEAGSVKYENN